MRWELFTLLTTFIYNTLPCWLYLSCYITSLGFPCYSAVKIHLLMQEMWVWSLDQDDPLEKEMATHSSILAWETPWTEELGGLYSMGSHRVGHDLVTEHACTHVHCITNICLISETLYLSSAFVQFPPTPPLPSGNHKPHLFLYECVCFWSITNL